MNGSFRLGKLLGIPIHLHYSWFFIFALVTLSLSGFYFPELYPDWSPQLAWGVGVATSLFFFASVVAHELTHSLVSMRFGVPVRSITLFIFGGVARISREPILPRGELLMALAGPLCSLFLGGLFWGLALLAAPVSQPVNALAAWLARINVLLAVFNLIPGFPLDGGRVFRSLVWGATKDLRRATRYATFLGQGIAYLFIFGGILLAFLTRDWVSGLWLAFIGWFLENAASSSYRQAVLRDALKGITAAEVMTQDCSLVPPNLSVQELVESNVLHSGRRCFMVASGEKLEGMITLHHIKAVARPLWPITPVSQAMIPIDQVQTASPQEEMVSLLERMDSQDINQLPVVEGGRLLGIVARDNILRFIRIHSELRA
jgi:Zn-dependent protease/CBS domain-containing protein